MEAPVLILFAKTPIPGKVKTRLQPPLTPESAARVAALFMELTLRRACAHWPGQVVLYAWPATHHPVLRSLGAELGIDVRRQSDGDLGRKMYSALADFGGRPAGVMGCDVPHCPEAILKHAAGCLVQGHNIIGPTRDGGYYLIGLQSPAAALFRDIPWGTDRVLDRTRQQATRLRLCFQTLPTLIDVDVFDDLLSVQSEFPEIAEAVLGLGLPDIRENR